MRLRPLRTVGRWTIVAPIDEEGVCQVFASLQELKGNRTTKATAVGFVALWDRIGPFGPKSLGTNLYHRVDNKNEINEFIKGDHRLLCFESDGSLIVCSHIFLKSGKKTPEAEKSRAAKLRKEYLAAIKLGEVEVEKGQ